MDGADKNSQNILWFSDINMKDTALVGGKNASLGEMYSLLTPMGVNIPNGFAITSVAYQKFLDANNLRTEIAEILSTVDSGNMEKLQTDGEKIRNLVLAGKIPDDLKSEITAAYQKLSAGYQSPETDVAVRSSATAEDLPGASFAGQQETFLNVSGLENLFTAIIKCFASLYTNRAISYRIDKGFDHTKVYLSVGIQKMVRTDLASSGIAFTIDTETGFDKVIIINGIYGLGELIVQGKIIPDEWLIFKETLRKGKNALISKHLGQKKEKLVYEESGGIKTANVSPEDQVKFCLNPEEVLKLADWLQKIEDHFSLSYGKFQPMDCEWGKDGKSGELFIVQARPETVQSVKNRQIWEEYQLSKPGNILLSGIAVGTKIASGKVHVIRNPSEMSQFQKGEILVTEITDPDWEPIMKIAAGIITDKGGRTSHAAIVSRELGIPCIVGTETASSVLSTGQEITLDSSSGKDGIIYDGPIPFQKIDHNLSQTPQTKTKIMVNIGSPDESFKNHYLPVKGVGLAREEFIIASGIKVHPKALVEFEKIKSDPASSQLVSEIENLTAGYKDKAEYFIEKLSSGIAKIGASFWPYQVIVRFSDFKTNEYRNLLGGSLFEPEEENPMIGWRGASRYYDEKYKDAFLLEIAALKRVHEDMGMVNIVPMIPFTRTVEELQKVLDEVSSGGFIIDRNHNAACQLPVESCPHKRIYMMCEIPSNILLADDFLPLIDGYSIGSNDLTQLTLGLDRDSGLLSHISNENNPAVKKLIAEAIQKCHNHKKYIGLCGQAPSDYPDFAQFLIENQIDSVSLNPDVVIKTIEEIAKHENNRS